MSVKRHSSAAIFMHWFNALCWILLLATGFGLISNDTLQPVAGWWVRFMESVFGGGVRLLSVHIGIALTWIAVYAVFIVLRWKADAWPFLREILDLDPPTDAVWTVRKGFWLVLGPRLMRRMGLDPNLPPQGFYNAGQKYVAIAAVLCSLGLVVSGVILLYTRDPGSSQSLAQWLIFIHFCCAGLMAVALPVHIYMAALAPGEAPALRSMFTGSVPEEHVKHHNPLWYEKLVRQGKIRES